MGRRLVRTQTSLDAKKRVLVVCEGTKTEASYFNAMKRHDLIARAHNVIIEPMGGRPSIRILRGLLTANDADSIWLVFDTECPPNRAEINGLNNWAREKGAEVCWSNPSFETWLLSHFVRSGALMTSCDSLIEKLDAYWQSEFRKRYEKNSSDIYELLKDKMGQAIENCAWLQANHHPSGSHVCDQNSSSGVYRLLESLLPKPIKQPIAKPHFGPQNPATPCSHRPPPCLAHKTLTFPPYDLRKSSQRCCLNH